MSAMKYTKSQISMGTGIKLLTPYSITKRNPEMTLSAKS